VFHATSFIISLHIINTSLDLGKVGGFLVP